MKSVGLLLAGSSVFAGSSALATVPTSLNLSSAFDPIKTSLASGGTDNIAVIGDSLSFRGGSWLYPFISKMQAAYGNAGAGYQAMSFQTGAGFDPNWTLGEINEDVAPHMGLDGLWASTTAKTSASFQPSSPNDVPVSQTATLQYVTQPGGGSFQQYYNANTGQKFSSGVISTASQSVGVGTYTFTPGSVGNSLPWYQTAGNGTVTLLGQYDSTGKPGVVVNRVANGGYGVDNFLDRDASFDSQLKLINPKLYFVWLGQNDQAYDEATYAAKIQQLVDRIKTDSPDAQICLVGTYDQGSEHLVRNVEAMYDVAAKDGLGFLNVYDGAGDNAFFQANGYQDADGVHLSDAGGEYLGQWVYNAFQRDGISVPEPTLGAMTLLAGSAFVARRRR